MKKGRMGTRGCHLVARLCLILLLLAAPHHCHVAASGSASDSVPSIEISTDPEFQPTSINSGSSSSSTGSLYSDIGLSDGAAPEAVTDALQESTLDWWRSESPCSTRGLTRAIQIQHAAQVLLSPVLRPAYDLLGLDPLEAAAASAIQRTPTPGTGTRSAGNCGAQPEATGGSGKAEGSVSDDGTVNSLEAVSQSASGSGAGESEIGSGGTCSREREALSETLGAGAVTCCAWLEEKQWRDDATKALECSREIWISAVPLQDKGAPLQDKTGTAVDLPLPFLWPSESKDLTATDVWENVFAESTTPWLILLLSPSDAASLALQGVWEMLSLRLQGMVRQGRVDAIREPQLALRLARVRERGSPLPSDPKKAPLVLPRIIGRPAFCPHSDCLIAFPGLIRYISAMLGPTQRSKTPSSSSASSGGGAPLPSQVVEVLVNTLEHFALVRMSPPRPFPVLHLSEVGPKFFQGTPAHKVRALLLLEAGSLAPPPSIQFWAAKLQKHMRWAAVLWSPNESPVWEKWWHVSSPPALGIYRDPNQDPIVFQGPFNASVLQVILERFSSFELPQLRRDSAAAIGCDPTRLPPPSPAAVLRWTDPGITDTNTDNDNTDNDNTDNDKTEGRGHDPRPGVTLLPGAFTRYCAVIVSSPSPAFIDARLLMLEIQRALVKASAALDDDEEGSLGASDKGRVGRGGEEEEEGESLGDEEEGEGKEPVGEMEGDNLTEGAVGAELKSGGSGGEEREVPFSERMEKGWVHYPGSEKVGPIPVALVRAWKEERLTLAWMDGTKQTGYCSYVMGWEGAQFCRKAGKEASVGLYFTLLRPALEEDEGGRAASIWDPSKPQFSFLVNLFRDGPVNDSRKIVAWMGDSVARGDELLSVPQALRAPPQLEEDETASIWDKVQERLSLFAGRAQSSVKRFLQMGGPESEGIKKHEGMVGSNDPTWFFKPIMTALFLLYLSWRFLGRDARQ